MYFHVPPLQVMSQNTVEAPVLHLCCNKQVWNDPGVSGALIHHVNSVRLGDLHLIVTSIVFPDNETKVLLGLYRLVRTQVTTYVSLLSLILITLFYL